MPSTKEVMEVIVLDFSARNQTFRGLLYTVLPAFVPNHLPPPALDKNLSPSSGLIPFRIFGACIEFPARGWKSGAPLRIDPTQQNPHRCTAGCTKQDSLKCMRNLPLYFHRTHGQDRYKSLNLLFSSLSQEAGVIQVKERAYVCVCVHLWHSWHN